MRQPGAQPRNPLRRVDPGHDVRAGPRLPVDGEQRSPCGGQHARQHRAPPARSSLLRVPGRWRVSIYPREDLPVEAQMTPEAMDASLQSVVPRGEPYEVAESRHYRVHMRMAGRYAALLDRYDRRRRAVARDEIMAQADRNRMRERDRDRRRALLAELQAITADPAHLRAYLLWTSMIEGLRRAAQVE